MNKTLAFNLLPYISIFSLTALIFVGLPLEFAKHYTIVETGFILSSFYVGTMIAPFFFYRIIIGFITTKIALIVNITAVAALFIAMFLDNGFFLSMFSLFILGVGKNVILTYYDQKVIDTNYHLYRGIGSIAFVLTALGIGLHYIDLYTIGIIISIIFFINYFSFLYINNEDNIIISKNFFSLKRILDKKYFWMSILLHRIGMGIFISFAGIFVVYTLGYSELQFSFMWVLAASLEGLVLLFYKPFLSADRFINYSLIATMVRFLLIFFFPEYFFILLLSQSLHVFSYAIYHLNILRTINKTFKERTPINIKVYHSISEGLGLFLGSIIGVAISHNTYFFFVLFCFTFLSFVFFQIAKIKENLHFV